MLPHPDINPGDIYPQGPIRPDISDDEGAVSLGEMLANLWEGRYIILATTVLALILGSYYVWRKSPIYQVDAMLQIEDKKGSSSPMMEALNGLLGQAAKSQAEIEIIKSNLVLGRTVETLALDIQATPATNRFIGDALVRGRTDAPELAIERFELPTYLRGTGFKILALENGAFRWEGPKNEPLATGKVGDEIKATYQGQSLMLQVRSLRGEPGQRFNLSRQPLLDAIEALRAGLTVTEKGKEFKFWALFSSTASVKVEFERS